jgi:transcription elongation factor Elf1
LSKNQYRSYKLRKQKKREKQYFPKIEKIFNKVFGTEKSLGCTCKKTKDGMVNMCEICWKFGKAKYAVFQYLVEDNLKTVFASYIEKLSKTERDKFRRYIFLEDMRQAGFSDLHTATILNEVYYLEDSLKKKWRKK